MLLQEMLAPKVVIACNLKCTLVLSVEIRQATEIGLDE